MNKQKTYGILSYNYYGNFMNYGSMLQAYALQKVLDKLNIDNVIVDYCTDALSDKNPYYPMKNMQDTSLTARLNCYLSLPAIRRCNNKFKKFWDTQYKKTEEKYNSRNFNNLKLDGYICGSDTIFCIQESEGFDDGFFANYECMKNKPCIAYGASFGDAIFSDGELEILKSRLQNFSSLLLREDTMIEFVRKNVNVLVDEVIDPTLLLEPEEYAQIISKPEKKYIPYVLVYSRRYNREMIEFAERLAQKHNLKVIEISLRAMNMWKHHMAYDAGIEEFLGLVKNAEYVVTNSFHGMVFGLQFSKDLYVFARESAKKKIGVLLEKIGGSHRLLTKIPSGELECEGINYKKVHEILKKERNRSIRLLEKALKDAEERYA